MDNKLLTLDDIATALGYITDYDDRDTWLRMGMAVKSEFGPSGFDVWDNWSRQSDLYKPADAKSVWKSIKESGRMGIGSLIKKAQDNGFRFSVKDISQDERERRKKAADARKIENKKRREQAAKALKETHQNAAQRSKEIWAKLPKEGHSEYLSKKKIHGFGCGYSRGSIAIPVTIDGELTGLQWIDKCGHKKFITGTQKQGAYYYIPGDTDTIVVCEGYATGCTIRMATHHNVLIAFDAGNLLRVVDDLKQREPDRVVLIAADNDHQSPKNKGLQVAQEAVEKHPDIIAYWPEFEIDNPGSDFNDLHVAKGLDAVSDVFNRGTPQAFPRQFTPENYDPANFSPPEPPAVDELPDNDWMDGIQRNDKGNPQLLSSNVARILQNHELWKGCLSYCDFSYKIIKQTAPLADMEPGEWNDADSARLAIWLSNTFKFEPSRNKLTDGIVVAAQRNRFHPVKDYLNGLTWDGTERLNYWLEDIFEAQAGDGYLAAVGSKLFIASVARIMRPGCKMDNVMILEGKQGLKKSTAVSVLFGEWFSDAPIPIGEKDAYQNIQGVWCCELAELDSFNKAESTSAKLFFSQTRDRYRPSYGQHTEDFPRQTIFIGTTNQGEYLKDYTGNRRYWPVKCSTVKLDQLKINRDQYWAEAVHRYNNGETWWVDDEVRQIFEKEQDQRMQLDPWHYRIEDWLLGQTKDFFTADEILTSAIEKPMSSITRADQNRVSPIMKKIGYKNVRKRIVINNEKVNRHVYVKDKEAEIV